MKHRNLAGMGLAAAVLLLGHLTHAADSSYGVVFQRNVEVKIRGYSFDVNGSDDNGPLVGEEK